MIFILSWKLYAVFVGQSFHFPFEAFLVIHFFWSLTYQKILIKLPFHVAQVQYIAFLNLPKPGML